MNQGSEALTDGRRQRPASDAPTLGADEVHVWRIDTDQAHSSVPALWGTLSPDERTRVSRLRSPMLQARQTVARGVLRSVLAQHLPVAPEDLRFVYGAHGKPSLAPDLRSSGVRFNLSHSENLVLVAVARGREVGVDVERVRPGVETAELSARWFSPSEAAAVAVLGEDEAMAMFFRIWARKEAYTKARGFGLSRSPTSFEIPDLPPGGCATVRDFAEPDASGLWHCRDLDLGAQWAAAVVASGADWRVRVHDW